MALIHRIRTKRVSEAKHRSYVYIVIGMGALLGFALIVQAMVPNPDVRHDASLHVLPTPAGAEKYPNANEPLTCSTELSPVLDESSKIKYDIMTPKILPEGYSLQGVDVISRNGVQMITLYYWDKPLCDIAKKLEGGPALNGAIVVRIADSYKVPDTYAKMVDSVNKMVPKYDFQKVVINGITAIANKPSLSDTDGFPYPARIFIQTNNMLYNIEANMPLEDLVKIAESIR